MVKNASKGASDGGASDGTESLGDGNGVVGSTDYNDIRSTPDGEPDGAIVSKDRAVTDRAADILDALAAPVGPDVNPADVRNPFRIRLEANGDPEQWEQGVVYASDLKAAESVAADAGMVHDGWHIVWVKPIDSEDASGLV